MKPVSEAAYLLRSVPYRDSDLIVTLLARDSGMVSLIARGAKKSRKRFGGALDFARLFRAEFTAPRESGLGTLSSVELISGFERIGADIKRYGVASHFVEVVRGMAREGDHSGEVFFFLDAAFRALEGGADPASLLRVFQARAIALMGYSLSSMPCSGCGETAEEDKTFASGGALFCSSCAPKGAVRFSAGAVKTLRLASSITFTSMGALRISKMTEEEISGIIEKSLVRALGSEPKSLSQIQSFMSD